MFRARVLGPLTKTCVQVLAGGLGMCAVDSIHSTYKELEAVHPAKASVRLACSIFAVSSLWSVPIPRLHERVVAEAWKRRTEPEVHEVLRLSHIVPKIVEEVSEERRSVPQTYWPSFLQYRSAKSHCLALDGILTVLLNEMSFNEARNLTKTMSLRGLVRLARVPSIDPARLSVGTHFSSGAIAREARAHRALQSMLGACQHHETRCMRHFLTAAEMLLQQGTSEERDENWRYGVGINELHPTFERNLNTPSAELIVSQCMAALSVLTTARENGEKVLRRDGLRKLLSVLLASEVGDVEARRECAHVLANLTRLLRQGMFNQSALQQQKEKSEQSVRLEKGLREWIGVLAMWMRYDTDLVLQGHAHRALENIHAWLEGSSLRYADGVFVLHSPEHSFNNTRTLPSRTTSTSTTDFTVRTDQSPSVDIIFVHGLLGGPFFTFRPSPLDPLDTDSVENVNWAKHWLAEDRSEHRILTLGYDTTLSEWLSVCPDLADVRGSRSIATRGSEMMQKLLEANVGERPIVWVTHSLGGLITKSILYQALLSGDPRAKKLVENTKGIVFYATPHLGSDLAALLPRVRYLLFPSVEVEEVCNSDLLTEIHSALTNEMSHISTLSLAETESTPLLEGLPWKKIVVTEQNAFLHPGENITVPGSDHLDLCKPVDRSDIRYTSVLSFIDRIALLEDEDQN